MRKELLFVIFVFLPVLSFGQELYKPLLEDGKVWTYHYYNDMTGRDFYESLAVSGDTIIDNRSYKRITDVETGSYLYGMREEEQKVFVAYPQNAGETLLYDFGLHVGDRFMLYNIDDPSSLPTVVSVDTVVVGSHSFRVLDVRPANQEFWPNLWVEGIGGMYYLTLNMEATGNNYQFSSCQLNGETLFTQKDLQIVGVRGLPVEDRIVSPTVVFDLQGRRLDTKPSKGIYISNGKIIMGTP